MTEDRPDPDPDPSRETLRDVEHTHPDAGETVAAAYRRGPTAGRAPDRDERDAPR
jgi:hypothetical protein